MDGNAWDLVEDEAGQDEDSGSSRSSSPTGSRSGALDTSEETNEPPDARLRRGKSPAVESLRKVSRIVLEKVGLRKRTKPPECVALKRTFDLPQFPLTLFCDLPKEFSYARDQKKIVSTEKLKQWRHKGSEKEREKCSYLFRSHDSGLEQAYAEANWATAQPERVERYDPFCPVHGSKRLLARKRKLLDMSSFVNSIDAADENELSPILSSDAILAKAIRKRQRALGAQGGHVLKSKRKIQSNLMIISLAFLFLFTGFHGLQYLQTSVNGQLGADALAIYYLSMAISSLIVPSFVVNRLGSKLTLIAAFGVHLVFMMAHFLPRYYSLIPASMLAGVSASCMWSAQSYYIVQSGINYAKLNVEAQNIVIVRFFGLFFMIVHIGQVCGTLLSSVILSNSMEIHALADEIDWTCGSRFPRNFSALSEQAKRNMERPSQLAYSSVVAVDLCCVLVAVMVVAFFLNALKKDEIKNKKPPKFTAEVLVLTLRNLQKPKVLLLIPLTIFNGIEQAFAVAVYPRAFVACGLGIASVGFVMTSFGIADAICSLVFGPLIKIVLIILTLIVWPLNPQDRALFNVIAGVDWYYFRSDWGRVRKCNYSAAKVWGMADAVWNTQVQGFWIGLTGRQSLEVAFANYRFWMSSGLAIGFFITHFTTVNQYLAASFVLLLIGILCYFVTELLDPIMAQFRRSDRRQAHFDQETADGKLVRKKSRRQSPSTRQDAKLKAKDGRY